jgi:formate hydrogenlyase subunit 6/NADH:ubiquinone oxidoreductase subunit I
LVTVPLFRLSPSVKRASEKLIRPPGALPEPQFLAKCVKCGECMKVCPTNGLQPTLSEAGTEGIWTPVLVPRVGYCEYYCSLCTQVCPTGAIEELTVEPGSKNTAVCLTRWASHAPFVKRFARLPQRPSPWSRPISTCTTERSSSSGHRWWT